MMEVSNRLASAMLVADESIAQVITKYIHI